MSLFRRVADEGRLLADPLGGGGLLINENQLDVWVRGNAQIAQGVIVELVYRMVAASSPNPKERRFPLGDSLSQPGPDGFLDAVTGFDPFVPKGVSIWEIGTGINAGDKATEDYKTRTDTTPQTVRQESTFIFVTPLSARRDWQYTWKEEAQAAWLEDRKKRNDWKDINVIDGTRIIDWLHFFPAVESWLGENMGLPIQSIEAIEQRWNALKTIGEPPPLIPEVFLANRDSVCEKLKEIFSGSTFQLQLDTYFPDQMVDVVAAYVASMDDDAKIHVVGRCIAASSADAVNAINGLTEPHILVAAFDMGNDTGTRLLEKARRARHSVIYGGMPGGIPHPNRVMISNPKRYQIEEALEKAGYKRERARVLAQKSDGNLGFLLKCLQNLSLMPEWAEGTHAADLAIAELLGSWNEKMEEDQSKVEEISGKVYGEWIGKMREIALRPGTPLIQREGAWKFISRYEGWFALGPRVFDRQLDLFKQAAVTVLREKNPKFDLPPEEQYMASIHGRELAHSHLLRRGLAETLALLGSHPEALRSCSYGKPEGSAKLAVREIMADADWVLWASLNDLLPLLAEAAPREFLDAVEKALGSDPCPFDTVFSQEGDGFTRGNYMTGLLWALETLAWDAQHLTHVIIILGELAARDPGGNWANRPGNSLSTILLPWHPQTCAPVSVRKAAVKALINELPAVAWSLLLGLLPQSHQMSMGSHKPEWREVIPDEWTDGVTRGGYWAQIDIYAELAIKMAKSEPVKLVDLIDRLDDLPPPAYEQLLDYLESEEITSMPEADRIHIWNELSDLVTKHRKFSDAKWALSPEHIEKIAAVAERLAPAKPFYHHQRLFGEQELDLYEEKGSYKEQHEELEKRRQEAISEIYKGGGVQAVLDFAEAVEAAWRVGFSFGMVAADANDHSILPTLLNSGNNSLAQFAGAFVQGRFQARGWAWVDEVETSQWELDQAGQFLAYLPFTPEAWSRSAKLLGKDESPYWKRTNANPYDSEEGLDIAVNQLIKYGRHNAAIRCLHRIHYEKQPLETSQVTRALLALPESPEGTNAMDVHDTIDLIKALQDDPSTNSDELFKVEWVYLALLDRQQDANPKLMEQRLADDPNFFCEVIQIVFRSKNEEKPDEVPSEEKKNIATNAYRLLSNWSIPPGAQKDGSFAGDLLSSWLEKVKMVCSESGHLEVAMTMIGHVLTHAPPDPDGLWIHHSAAAALNAKDAKDMRDGFSIEFYNSRGVHWVDPEAKEERELAAKYRMQANEVESSGYHRLAGTLRELAETYEREAKQRPTRDPFED